MEPKTKKQLIEYMKADLGYSGRNIFKAFLKRYFLEAGYRFIFWLRITRYLYLNNNRLLFVPAWFMLKGIGHKYHFDISYRAQIGRGLRISHFGYIIVTGRTTIGNNCGLRPGVVFGNKLSEETKGAVVGDNVEFGVGCKILGDVNIGDNVIVGANSVVTKNIPSNVNVAGIPAKII